MIHVKINNSNYEVEDNISIFEACQQRGVEIPSFCYDDRLEPKSICRLSIVEIDGRGELINSCSHNVEDGMIINTHSDRVISTRKEILDEMLLNHLMDCQNCIKSYNCKLKSYCNEYGVTSKNDMLQREIYPIDESNPFYIIDPNKCISCNLCVRVCNELQGRGSLELNDKGYVVRRSSNPKGSYSIECESCGNCITVCPVGAIIPKDFHEEYATEMTIEKNPTLENEKKHVKTTCSYCGVGCQLELVVKDEKVVDVNPVKVPPNNGLLCVKGKFGHKYINHPDRLTTPLIRKDGRLVAATWEEAYSLIIERAKDLRRDYGSDVFAGLSSARCTNEDNYLFQKLIRAVFGTNNIDHCARL